MDTTDYWQQAITPIGSDLYYSTRFLSDEKREAILLIAAFCHEIKKTIYKCREQELIQAKLAWWMEEVAQLFSATPSHPISKAIQKIVKSYGLTQDLFYEVIQGAIINSQYQGYHNFGELIQHCHRDSYAYAVLKTKILSGKSEESLKAMHDLKISGSLIATIFNLKNDILRGCVYLPDEDLHRFSVSLQSIYQLEVTDNLRKLLQEYIKQAEIYYQSAIKKFPTKERYYFQSELIAAELSLCSAHKLAENNFPVFENKIDLIPLKKLWLAWRIYQREKRAYKKASSIKNK